MKSNCCFPGIDHFGPPPMGLCPVRVLAMVLYCPGPGAACFRIIFVSARRASVPNLTRGELVAKGVCSPSVRTW